MKREIKTFFAVIAVALMMAVAIVPAIGNDNASDAAVINPGEIPEMGTYGYVIKLSSTTTNPPSTITNQLAAVVYADAVSHQTGEVVYAAATSMGRSIPTAMETVFKFDASTGLGPFNSFYAAINVATSQSDYAADEAKEYRINNKIGGVAYVLNPDNLRETLAGIEYTPQLYNVMLVIPTIYWDVYTDGSSNTYLCISNTKDFAFSSISTSSVSLSAYTTFANNAEAYAHTFSDASTAGETTFPYIALGVYESYRTAAADTSYGLTSGQLVSQADRVPTASTTEANFRAAAKVGNNDNDNGTYMLWNYYQWTLYKMMSYTVMGNMNSQFVMGFGNTGTTTGADTVNTGRDSTAASSVTGATSKAYELSSSHGTSGYAVSLFLENGWGSLWEFVDDTVIKNTSGDLLTNNRLVVSSGNLQVSELTDSGIDWAQTTGNSGKAIDGASIAAEFWNTPTSISSSATADASTAVNDAAWFNLSDDRCLFVGGAWYYKLNAGVAAALASNAVSISRADVGARLAYAMTADAAVATTTADTYVINIDDEEYVTVKNSSGQIISDGDEVDQDSTITVTLNSRIPEGEKLIITTYAMLGKPMYFDSTSAIGDVKSFKVTADLFIYLDNGMLKTVVYQPDIYDTDGDRQDGKEAVTVQLSQSVNSQVWASYRIANSSNTVIASDSMYFTGDSITIQLEKQTVSNLASGDSAKAYTEVQTATSLSEPTSGDWIAAAIAVSDTQSYQINKGEKIYALSAENTWAAYTIDGEGTLELYNNGTQHLIITITEVETNTNVYKIVPTVEEGGTAGTIYIPATHYKDWNQGTYYFSLQTENGYINVVNFPFKVGAYKITIADGSRDYVSMITVNGVERYTLQANEIAQITIDSAAIAELGDYHVFITYNDTMVELTSTSSGVYRFSMPAYNVVVSVSQSADGYAIGITYTYGSDEDDIGYRAIIYSGAGTAVPSGTISGEVYGVVSGKLYDGTKFNAVVHETLLSGVYDSFWLTKDSGDWIKAYAQTTATTYYVAAGETIHYLNSSGGISSFVVNTTTAPSDKVNTSTWTINALGESTFYSIAVSDTASAEVIYLPLTSTITSAYDSTNDEIGTATLSGTAVTFTKEEGGNWIKVEAATSDTQAYYVANGAEIFYPSAEGYSSFVVNTTVAPTVTGGTLTITALGDATVPQAYKLEAVATTETITLYVPLTSVITSAYADKDVIGEYDEGGFDYTRSEILTFIPGSYITGLNQVTAVIPYFSPAGGATVVGNQYFASAYTASANVASIKVDRSNGDVLFLMDNVDSTGSASYTIDLYYNYDVRTGQSTRTVMDKVTVSGTITGPVDIVSIDYESLGIEKSKVVVYSAKVGSNDTLRVAI